MPFSSSEVTFSSSSTVMVASPEQRTNAMTGAQLTQLVQNLYSIVLYDTVADATLAVTDEKLDPAGRTGNAEYFFTVPPKVLEFGEPFATTVTPTQNGGKSTESYGSIIKNIKVSGTTGLRPNKSSSPTVPLLGISDQQISTLMGNGLSGRIRTVPADEKTGWDDIMFLRNIFRKYSDLKSSDSLAGRVVMLWRNIKDGDYWVVEPEDFRLSQSSNSPLTYEYSISFKTLTKFDFSYSLPPDPMERARSRTRMLARLQEYNQNLLNIFLTISNSINRVQGWATFISNTILAPIVNVVNGLNAVKTSAFGVVRGLGTQARTLVENLDTATAQLVASGTFEVQDPFIRSLRRCSMEVAKILTEPVAAESSVSDANLLVSRYSAAYERAGTLTTSRRAPSSSTYIGASTISPSVSSGVVNPGEDIRDLASRLLGDPNRWRELVVLNRLRSPFISATGGPGVLAPGDRILFPQDGTSGGLTTTNNPTNNEYTGPDDPVVRAYGRDLMLKSTLTGTDELTDLVLNQGGDLAAIQGTENVQQAIRIKFMTERKELPAHPKFGAKYAIGRKATPSSFNELRINTLNTLASDTRIAQVRNLQFLSAGDKLAAKVDLVLINARGILSTSLALRRF